VGRVGGIEGSGQGREGGPAGRLLDLDPDLGEQLEPDRFELARRHLVVRLGRVRAGTWVPQASAFRAQGGAGLLIAEGLALREVRLERRRISELLGPGDVLRPWQDDGEHAHYPFDASLEIVQPLLLAVLDRAFLARCAAFPDVAGALFGRAMARSRALAGTFAIAQMRRADEQVLIKLWHLADRFGRVTPDGIRLPLPLTHAMLAGILGMHRPAVTTALGALKDQRLVLPQDVGWLLCGEPPEHARLLSASGGLVRAGTAADAPARVPGS
jgi:CRP-like cAMP-binding protein